MSNALTSPLPDRGSCLCGQTAIEVRETCSPHIVCHCSDCHALSALLISYVACPISAVTITFPCLRYYDTVAASGNILHRQFCGGCGANIAHTSDRLGEKIVVDTARLPRFKEVPIDMEFFVKDKWQGLKPIEGAKQFEMMHE
ncbi:Mss4-like protein [Leucosporidium creatinivorum]|uniref:Mss4-like protein n=1 Tax=Leucosporidium creatinivorum TaxID=106004 RepID=A0A1Y2F672_9BASI|nr:Mss4-like protein [Leucosporidium creatinivorum]